MKLIFCLKTLSSMHAMIFIACSLIAQNEKDVNEKCEVNGDCKSGNCVTVKDGGKVCSDCTQDQLNGFTAVVDEKCKQWDKGILGYSDLVNEFNSKNEVSLVILNVRMEACKACYTARSDREHACWKGGDPGHIKQMDEMKKSMNYLDGLMNEKMRNKLAYNCGPDVFDHTQHDIDENCKDLDNLFEKYGHDDDKQVDCGEISKLLDKCIDCREAWKSMIDECFKNGASDQRMKRYNEVLDMEKITKETLDSKKSKNLCK